MLDPHEGVCGGVSPSRSWPREGVYAGSIRCHLSLTFVLLRPRPGFAALAFMADGHWSVSLGDIPGESQASGLRRWCPGGWHARAAKDEMLPVGDWSLAIRACRVFAPPEVRAVWCVNGVCENDVEERLVLSSCMVFLHRSMACSSRPSSMPWYDALDLAILFQSVSRTCSAVALWRPCWLARS